jgi:sulfite exporter TauE/SafE
VYGSLFLAGLAGSLHCVAMCGPILFAFRELRDSAPKTNELGTRATGLGATVLDALGYHAGRIWTYGALGLVAGWAGVQLRHGAALFGWQRPLAALAGLVVLAAGLAAFGALPGFRVPTSFANGCVAAASRWPWLAALVRGRQPLLLGAVMGLIPCGLVYAVLVIAAAMPTPWHAALAMIAFGLGTLPALTALVAGSRALPRALLAKSPKLAALMLVLAGLVMLARSLFVVAH